MHFPFKPKLIAILIVSASTLTLSACSKSEVSKSGTQIAAKVNGAEISVHQINAVLSQASGVTSENAPLARKEILNRLVDQELVVGQALSKKLDRTTDVMAAIEAARRDVISRAYMEQVAASATKPTTEEIRHYYEENPYLFAKRRVYNIQELNISKDSGSLDGLKEFAGSGKSMEETLNWLKTRKIQAKGGASTQPAEQIPLELLPRIATMKDGQTAFIDTPKAVILMHIASSQSASVDEKTASPVIEQYLLTQRKTKAVADEMKRLKEAGKVEYVGDFANVASALATPAAAATPKEMPATPAVAPQSVPTTDNKQSAAIAIEKGVAGLK